MKQTIPFHRVQIQGDELERLAAAIASGQLAAGGAHSTKASELLETYLPNSRVLLTTSGTAALEMAAHLLDISAGDEVIIPSFTFTSTANAFVLRGATPVFCDIRADTLNLDERLLPALLTDRTKAIVPVHYAGIGCEMESIVKLASSRSIALVEDAAHALFGQSDGRPLGTFGSLAALSFHQTKNISCGEGGALVVNEPQFLERATTLLHKGTDRSKFLAGNVPAYTWIDIGSSFAMGELAAAFLVGQLVAAQEIQSRRAALWQQYHRSLAHWATTLGITQPSIPSNVAPAWHAYYLVLPTETQRAHFLTHMQRHGVMATFHYQPLHSSAMGRKWARHPCPVAERVASCLVRLPLFSGLTDSEQEYVIQTALTFSS